MSPVWVPSTALDIILRRCISGFCLFRRLSLPNASPQNAWDKQARLQYMVLLAFRVVDCRRAKSRAPCSHAFNTLHSSRREKYVTNGRLQERPVHDRRMLYILAFARLTDATCIHEVIYIYWCPYAMACIERHRCNMIPTRSSLFSTTLVGG